MPRIHVIGTGGTIASTVDPDTGATVASVDAADLVARVPALGELAEVASSELARVNSWDVTPSTMVDVARAAAAALDGGADGVVVTHGTDTMEETAFVLELLLGAGAAAATGGPPRTVVCTGAMRGADADGPDGPRNLLAAARVALDPACAGLGGLLVLDEEVHAGRHVVKGHTTALSTFHSPATGPLGTVDADGVLLRWRPSPLPALPGVASADDAAPVDGVVLAASAAGHDDLLLRAALEHGVRGVVLVGTGAGNVPATWQPAVRELLERDVPVLLSSRCAAGRVVPAYGGDGGGHTLVGLGVVPTGDLGAAKSRLALQLLLGAGADHEAVRAWFAALDAPPPAVGDGR